VSIMSDAAWKICQKHGGVWGEYPDHDKDDWRTEVANDDTVLGYWQWVECQIQQKKDEEEAG